MYNQAAVLQVVVDRLRVPDPDFALVLWLARIPP